MFRTFSISDLGNIEADIYMKALCYAASSDGVIQLQEREFIEEQTRLLSIDPGEYIKKPPKDLSFLCNFEASGALSQVIFRDCMLIVASDGFVDDLEKTALLEIADKLSLKNEQVEEISNWIKELKYDL